MDPTRFEFLTYDFFDEQYSILDERKTWVHDKFRALTTPKLHPYCGSEGYIATFDGEEISTDSEPMTYDGNLRQFTIQTDDFSYVKTFASRSFNFTVQAFLLEYPQVKSEAVQAVMIIKNPCKSPKVFELNDVSREPTVQYRYYSEQVPNVEDTFQKYIYVEPFACSAG